jgi:hypothetical protein
LPPETVEGKKNSPPLSVDCAFLIGNRYDWSKVLEVVSVLSIFRAIVDPYWVLRELVMLVRNGTLEEPTGTTTGFCSPRYVLRLMYWAGRSFMNDIFIKMRAQIITPNGRII